MRRNFLIGLGLVLSFCVDGIAADLRVMADVIDTKAATNPVRSLDVTALTLGDLKKEIGILRDHQGVSIWCEGSRMGASGLSSFDVFYGDKLSPVLRKIGATLGMSLIQLCHLHQTDFERRRR